MFNKLIIICWVVLSSAFFYRPFIRKNIKLDALRIIDHNMENKTIYDKYEYYAMIGDAEKAKKYLIKILEASKNNNSD